MKIQIINKSKLFLIMTLGYIINWFVGTLLVRTWPNSFILSDNYELLLVVMWSFIALLFIELEVTNVQSKK